MPNLNKSVLNLPLLLLLTLTFKFANAQIQDNTSDNDTLSHEEIIENLVDVNQVVYQLRKDYGIHGSVLLSKTLWQILKSYSNQKQAQTVWQTAINQVTDLKNFQHDLHSINPRYNSGQILNQYTHGMNLEKWNKSRTDLKINRDNVGNYFATFDDLVVYFDLNRVWEIILHDIAKNDNIQWNIVFLNSLDLFSDYKNPFKTKGEDESQTSKSQFFIGLKRWEINQYSLDKLADLMNYLDTSDNKITEFYKNIIRFELNKSSNHYLNIAFNWFNVVEQLYLYKPQGVNVDVKNEITQYIEQNDTWFLSKEQQLANVNMSLPDLIEDSTHQLKLYYQDSEAQNLSTVILPSIYNLISGDLSKYMQSPFRKKIKKELEICLNISEEFAPLPQQPIDEKQFKGCVNDMKVAAITEASSRELSGSLTKISNTSAIDRALESPSWQIINIIYAYLAKNDCLKEEDQLVNPLEWTLAAESLLWFADRWPAYFQQYPQNDQIQAILKEGEKFASQRACIKQPISDILDSEFQEITNNWQKVKSSIKLVVEEYKQLHLSNGSDIDLIENSEKQSNFRVEDLKITACNAQNSCGVHINLESSRALFGLFPNHLLVAHQLKMGELNICYDDIGWENKRIAPTHLDNNNVSNYFGNFSFSIKGFYEDQQVFNRKIVDSKEYLYLFAANTDDVLNTYCPLSIVGDKISTKLARGTFGLVPNRLTFLTASRVDESKIFQSNWLKKEEWRDKIISDQAQIIEENKLPDLNVDVQKLYQEKAAQLQNTIYQVILNQKQEPSDIQNALYESFMDMQRSIKLLSSINYFLQTDQLMSNDDLHAMFFGSGQLVNTKSMTEFYQNQVNINVLISNIDKNLENNTINWNALKDLLSKPHLNSILYRLKNLIPKPRYRKYDDSTSL